MTGEIDWLFWYILIGMFFFIEAIAFVVVFWVVRRGGLWKLMMYRLRGGSLIINALGNNGIRFGLSKKAKAVETFESLNERGEVEKLPTDTRIVKHHLDGTSNPIHICVTGVNDNIGLLKKYQPDQSAHHLNQWGKGLFMEGITVGKAMVIGQQKDLFGKIQQWLIILQFCMMIAILAMNYMILSNMTPAA